MNSFKEYIYDIFISYRRHTPVEVWVERYFYPELMKWLPEELPPMRKLNVFFDKRIKPGEKWPAKLCQALRCSRLLLPVLSSPYFGSPWCISELHSIQAREHYLKLSCEYQTDGLIYPVVFSDGKYFPDNIKHIQHRDMKKWASTAEAFESSKDFLTFESEVKQIARDISLMLDKSPPYDPNWPIVEVEEKLNDPAMSMQPPRFTTGGNS